jgi:hypothetical protein
VDNAIKDKLQTESQMKGTTLNNLVNQVLRKYTEWDRFAKDVGFATITKAFLRAILEQLDEKTISTIAVSTCRGALRDATIYINGALDYSGFLRTIDLWLDAANVPFRHTRDDKGIHHYNVQHELGKKWSIYFAAVVNALLVEIDHRTDGQIISSDSVSFSIVKARK